jgi:hypothetical protein|nr:MAG TPA: hypothetical protein [Caudoviricetes sp.]
MEEHVNGGGMELQEPESSSLESVDEIAALLDGDDAEEQQEEGEGTEEQPSEEDGTCPEEEPEEPEEQPEPEAEDVPEGWDGEVFKALPPDARKYVTERERAHAEAISSRTAERDRAVQEKTLYEQSVSSELQTALRIVHDVVNGEFAGIDWLKLQREDPQAFLALDAERKMRMEGIQNLHQNVIKAQQHQQQQAAELSARELKSEFDSVFPEVKALYGEGFEPKKYLSEVTEWMRAQGVPEGVFGQISKGYELKAITKAMLYDKTQEARKAAAKKLAESPKVQPPKGRPAGDNESADRVRTARALLHKNPNSTDAIVAMLEAGA